MGVINFDNPTNAAITLFGLVVAVSAVTGPAPTTAASSYSS